MGYGAGLLSCHAGLGILLYDPTYREMISAGNLGLIPDPDLRRTLGDYYSAGFDQKQFVSR